MNTNDKLSELFDVQPIESCEGARLHHTNVEVIEPSSPNEELSNDYSFTRSNLHALLQQGQDALYHALEVAKQSEHPRAFEVVGGLMKNLSDINHQLLSLHQKKQSIEKDAKTTDLPIAVNNNSVFIGSTSELSKMLNDIRKSK